MSVTCGPDARPLRPVSSSPMRTVDGSRTGRAGRRAALLTGLVAAVVALPAAPALADVCHPTPAATIARQTGPVVVSPNRLLSFTGVGGLLTLLVFAAGLLALGLVAILVARRARRGGSAAALILLAVLGLAGVHALAPQPAQAAPANHCTRTGGGGGTLRTTPPPGGFTTGRPGVGVQGESTTRAGQGGGAGASTTTSGGSGASQAGATTAGATTGGATTAGATTGGATTAGATTAGATTAAAPASTAPGQPVPVVPETPIAAIVPLLGLGVLGAGIAFLLRRRRSA